MRAAGTEVADNERIDGLVGFEVEGHFFLLPFVRENRADEDDEAIVRASGVKLETSLRGCDS